MKEGNYAQRKLGETEEGAPEMPIKEGNMNEGEEEGGDEVEEGGDEVMEESTRPIVVDSRKFLQHLNSGAQAKIQLIGERVKEMGEMAGKNYELASLHASSLVFEDKDTNTYYAANVSKKGSKLVFESIRPIKVVETGLKASEYDKALVSLVESVSCSDFQRADKLFNTLSGGFKFKNRVIPESGIVHLRDGSIRKISVADRIVSEDSTKNIGQALRSALSNDVNIMEGRVVSASFSTNKDKIRIPINDWTRCRLRANEMRQVAEGAYKSPAFSKLVKTCAALVSEGDLKGALQEAREVLEEQQEFCLMTREEFTTLVENALATQAEFNPFLARDTAKLLYRAALKLNRGAIIESWQRSAQISSEPALFEAAGELDNAKDTAEFEAQYEGFLDGVFNEAEDVLASKAKVYRMCLQILSSVLSNLETSQQEADALTQMAEALSETPDHATIMQAEELLSQVSDDIIDAVETLHTFDSKQEEQDDSDDEEMGEEPVELPDVEVPSEEPVMPEAGAEEAPAEEGAPEGAPSEELSPAPALPESKNLNRMTISERRQYAINRFGHVFIEDENRQELETELEAWKINGSKYIMEEGTEESIDQMNRFERRCAKIGAHDLVDEFRTLRENIMIYNDVLGKHDPYGETLAKRGKAIFDREVNQKYRGFSTSESKGHTGKPKSSDGASPDTKYVAKATGGGTKSSDGEMDTLGGEGVADETPDTIKGNFSNEASDLKKVKVRSESTYKQLRALEEELDALDAPKGNGLQSRKTHDSDGYTASNKNVDAGLEGEDGHPIEPAKGEGLLKRKAKQFDGYSPTNKNVDSGLEGEDGYPLERGEGNGVAKRAVIDSDGRDGGNAFGESQYKWSTNASARRQSGRRKNRLFPKNKALDEDVKVSVSGTGLDGQETSYAATYPEGEPADVIAKIMAAMKEEVAEAPEAPVAPEEVAAPAEQDTAKIEQEIQATLDQPDTEIEGVTPEQGEPGAEGGELPPPPAAPVAPPKK